MRTTGNDTWPPSLRYSTNLLTTNWWPAIFSSVYTNGTNYLSAVALSNVPTVFYRIVCTNGF